MCALDMASVTKNGSGLAEKWTSVSPWMEVLCFLLSGAPASGTLAVWPARYCLQRRRMPFH